MALLQNLCPLGRIGHAIDSSAGLASRNKSAIAVKPVRGLWFQAIDEHGRIDHRECLHCLDCMILYTDDPRLSALGQGRKSRERAGLPLIDWP